jgi:adenosylmethionine-8-amino-7-oxononanoate aminotransferase
MGKLENKDKKYVWHPFTQMRGWVKEEQLVIERGDGIYLYDTNGRKYIDGVSSLWVNVHGHRKKELDKAVKSQLSKIAHSTLLGLGSTPSIKLAEKLIKITPKGLNKVFYSDNGSTAVEIALKIAFQYCQQTKKKQKTKFLTLVNAYHGDTVGSVSVGGIDLFHKMYKPLLFKAFKAPSPYCYRCPIGKSRESCKMECVNEVEKIMKRHHRKIAAMIVEPMVQAAAGMITMPKGYLKAVRSLCDKYEITLICDEVAAGFGRTGKMFACEHEKISPDIMCVAKSITGGYLPIAATLTTNKIYNAFLGKHEEMKTFFHGHTYTGNPLGCAVALANLEIFRREKTVKAMLPKIKYLRKRLGEFNKLPVVGDIRQLGFMVGIELKGFSYKERVGHKVILEARKRGLMLRPLGNVIVLMPPLAISKKDLEKLLDITYKSIETVTT